MIAVDTNLLVYSHREDSPFHAAAKKAVETLRQGKTAWGIPWPCVHEFISIVTHPSIYKNPTPLEVALAAVNAWAATGNLVYLAEGDGYLKRLESVAVAGRVKGPKIHDARIAALCLFHGVNELWSAGRDFSAFPQLKTRNPLLGKALA